MNHTTDATIPLLELKHQLPVYSKWPISVVRGRGTRVWDADGNEYLDFYGGHCVALIGHSHPRWVEAISRQAARLGFYSNVAFNDVRADFQRKLVEFAGDHLTHVFLCNSGAESNETAVKLAMKATGRTGVAAMKGGFHGRTAGALSVTHLGRYREQFPAVVRETAAVAFGDVDALRSAMNEDTAAVILEPVQSMNGMACCESAYYRNVVSAAHENGTLVIFDEVQTGVGRLGAPFATDFYGAAADIVTSAKGLGNGFPIGAVLTTTAVAETAAPGEQGTTFGGGPLACAAASAVLDVVVEENLCTRAANLGSYAREMLLTGPVRGVLGEGLLIGLALDAEAKKVCSWLRERGFLTGTSAVPNILRLMPPLTVAKQEFDSLASALAEYSA